MSAKQKVYRFRVQGHLPKRWSAWFEGLEIRPEPDGETVLVGRLPDQTALHGVLVKIRDLGLTLVEVKLLERPPSDKVEGE